MRITKKFIDRLISMILAVVTTLGCVNVTFASEADNGALNSVVKSVKSVENVSGYEVENAVAGPGEVQAADEELVHVDRPSLYGVYYNTNDGAEETLDFAEGEDGYYVIKDTKEIGIERKFLKLTWWSDSQDGQGNQYLPGETITLDSNMQLYAQWEFDPTPTALSFGAPSGNHTMFYLIGVGDEQYRVAGIKQNETRIIKSFTEFGWTAPPDYKFVHWSTTLEDIEGRNDNKRYYPGDEITFDMTSPTTLILYAQYRGTGPTTYSVTYGSKLMLDDNDKNWPMIQRLEEGDYLVQSPDDFQFKVSTLSGKPYDFVGWAYDEYEENPDKLIQPGDIINLQSNVILYAQWKRPNEVFGKPRIVFAVDEYETDKYRFIVHNTLKMFPETIGSIPTVDVKGLINDYGFTFRPSDGFEYLTPDTVSPVGKRFLGWKLYVDIDGSLVELYSGHLFKPGEGETPLVHLGPTGDGKYYYVTYMKAQWEYDDVDVVYYGDGADSGVPPDSEVINTTNPFSPAANDHVGRLVKKGYELIGWTETVGGEIAITRPHPESSGYYAIGYDKAIDKPLNLYPVWLDRTGDGFKVTYGGNGADYGSPPADAKTYAYDEEVTVRDNDGVPEKLRKIDNEFSGWKSGTEEYAAGDKFYIQSDKVLNAQWNHLNKPGAYTLKYDGNGAEIGTPHPDEAYSYSEKAVLKNENTLIKEGSQFGGWTVGSVTGPLKAVGDYIYVESDPTTVYAKWNVVADVTVTYSSSGSTSGTAPASATVKYNDFIPLPSNTGNLQREGHDFGGWTETEGGSTPVDPSKRVTVNVTLYPLWQTAGKVNVYYHLNGATGTVPEPHVNLDKHTEITVKGNDGDLMINPGKTFEGWDEDQNATTASYKAGDKRKVNEDKELYAVWMDDPSAYNVAYDRGPDAEPGVGSPPVDPNNPYKYNEIVTVLENNPTDPYVKVGSRHVGWQDSATGTPYSVGSTFPIKEDKTFVPIWQADPKEYIVTYDANGGVGNVPSGRGIYNALITTPNPDRKDFNRPGHILLGWSYDSTNVVADINLGETFRIRENTVLFATWELSSDVYTVVYDGGSKTAGDVPTDSKQYSVYDKVTVQPASLFRQGGYLFKGWSRDQEYVTEDPGTENFELLPAGAVFTIYEDSPNPITLYPVWEPNPPQYVVKYNAGVILSGGAVPVDDNLYAVGDEPVVLGKGTMILEGNKFGGWATARSAVLADYQEGDALKPITRSVNLYAVWILDPTRYSVNYSAAGADGTPPASLQGLQNGEGFVIAGRGTLYKYDDYESDGYKFAGWKDMADGKVYSEGDRSFIDGADVNFVSVWEVDTNKYSVLYRLNGGIGIPPYDATLYKNFALVTVLDGKYIHNPRHKFLGWAKDPSADVQEYVAGDQARIEDADLVLYAVWERDDALYTVSYAPGAGDVKGTPPPPHTGVAGDNFTVAEPVNLVNEGHKFVNWRAASDGSTYGLNSEFIIKDNDTLVAQWVVDDNGPYTVRYDANGGDGTVPEEKTGILYNESYTVEGYGDLEKIGYEVWGWSEDPDALFPEYFPTQKIRVTHDITFYAVWQEKTDTYSVYYFNAVSDVKGALPVDSKLYRHNERATLLGGETLHREGYKFTGWTDLPIPGQKVYLAGEPVKMTKNLVLFSAWEKVDENYTVTFLPNIPENISDDDHGGDAPAAQSRLYGAAIEAPGQGTMWVYMYRFLGWARNSAATVPDYVENDSIYIEDNFNLYAVWKFDYETKFNVVYDLNGKGKAVTFEGDFPYDITQYNYNDKVIVKSANLIMDEHVFEGWSFDENAVIASYIEGDEFHINDSNTENRTATLYAVWRRDTNLYSVIYRKNGYDVIGEAPEDPNLYSVGQKAPLKDNVGDSRMRWVGHKFVGWGYMAETAVEDALPALTEITVNRTVILYAVWDSVEGETYKVVYDLNGGEGEAPKHENPDGTEKTFAYGETATLLGGLKFGNPEYDFKGWTLKPNEGDVLAVGEVIIIDDKTLNDPAVNPVQVKLYASWGDIPDPSETHKVIYVAQNHERGEAPVDDNNYFVSKPITVLGQGSMVPRTGETFLGWRTEEYPEEILKEKDTIYMRHEDITLYSIWQPYSGPRYTVTYYDSDNDKQYADVGVIPGYYTRNITDEVLVAKDFEDNSFEGWYLYKEDPNGIELIEDSGIKYSKVLDDDGETLWFVPGKRLEQSLFDQYGDIAFNIKTGHVGGSRIYIEYGGVSGFQGIIDGVYKDVYYKIPSDEEMFKTKIMDGVREATGWEASNGKIYKFGDMVSTAEFYDGMTLVPNFNIYAKGSLDVTYLSKYESEDTFSDRVEEGSEYTILGLDDVGFKTPSYMFMTYILAGWATDEDMAKDFTNVEAIVYEPGDVIKVDKKIDLYAIFELKYGAPQLAFSASQFMSALKSGITFGAPTTVSISYDNLNDNPDVTDNAVAIGSTYTIRGADATGVNVPANAILAYWTENIAGTGEQYAPGSDITAEHSMILYPQFKGTVISNDIQALYIRWPWDNSEQTVFVTDTKDKDEPYTFLDFTDTGFSLPPGYKFDGWRMYGTRTVYDEGPSGKTLRELTPEGSIGLTVEAKFVRDSGPPPSERNVYYVVVNPDDKYDYVMSLPDMHDPATGSYYFKEYTDVALRSGDTLPAIQPVWVFHSWNTAWDDAEAPVFPNAMGQSYSPNEGAQIMTHTIVYSIWRRADYADVIVRWFKQINGVKIEVNRKTDSGVAGLPFTINEDYENGDAVIDKDYWELTSPASVTGTYGTDFEVEFVYELRDVDGNKKEIRWVKEGVGTAYTETLVGEHGTAGTVGIDDFGYDTELRALGWTPKDPTLTEIQFTYGDGVVGEFVYVRQETVTVAWVKEGDPVPLYAEETLTGVNGTSQTVNITDGGHDVLLKAAGWIPKATTQPNVTFIYGDGTQRIEFVYEIDIADPDNQRIVGWYVKDLKGVVEENPRFVRTYTDLKGKKIDVVHNDIDPATGLNYDDELKSKGYELTSASPMEIEIGLRENAKFIYELDTTSPKTLKRIRWIKEGDPSPIEYDEPFYGENGLPASVAINYNNHDTDLRAQGWVPKDPSKTTIDFTYGDGIVEDFVYVREDDVKRAEWVVKNLSGVETVRYSYTFEGQKDSPLTINSNFQNPDTLEIYEDLLIAVGYKLTSAATVNTTIGSAGSVKFIYEFDSDRPGMTVNWTKEGEAPSYSEKLLGEYGTAGSIVVNYNNNNDKMEQAGLTLKDPSRRVINFTYGEGKVEEFLYIEPDTTYVMVTVIGVDGRQSTKLAYGLLTGRVGETIEVSPDSIGFNSDGWSYDAALNKGRPILRVITLQMDNDPIDFYFKKVNNAPSYGGPKNYGVNLANEEIPLSPPILTGKRVRFVYGYPDSTIKADDTITRAEVASVFYSLVISTDKNERYSNQFTDVDSSVWYHDAVTYLKAHGILNGYEDGTFRPDQPVTKAEITKVAVSFGEINDDYEDASFADITENSWESIYVNAAVANGWFDMTEDGTFGSNEFVSRAQVISIINKVLNRSIDSEGVDRAASLYTDINRTHWAYQDIMEASTNYEDIETYEEARRIELARAAEANIQTAEEVDGLITEQNGSPVGEPVENESVDSLEDYDNFVDLVAALL
ncbi:MAG: InlB B-repeat-containing protein [Clostridiales bacterium]|jgi:hypothetical protein|nr:InlB B-repeat-containing protein [Clostridiales bacterium]